MRLRSGNSPTKDESPTKSSVKRRRVSKSEGSSEEKGQEHEEPLKVDHMNGEEKDIQSDNEGLEAKSSVLEEESIIDELVDGTDESGGEEIKDESDQVTYLIL